MSQVFLYGEEVLTASKALAIAQGSLKGMLSSATQDRITKSAEHVAHMVAKGEPVYGINTGFGPLCTTTISKEETNTLQTNILKSHSVGVGEPISEKLAKLMLILKVHALRDAPCT